PEIPKKSTSVIYSFENFVLEKYLLEDERKANLIPSKTKFKVSFNPKDVQINQPIKENSTGYPNTNKDI
ncbi:hypothetical protein CONCODRAFT_13337, partial [Conidiobolus coronatus NRRL 28638]